MTFSSATLNYVGSCGSGERCSWFAQYRQVGTTTWTQVPTAPNGPVNGPISDTALSENVSSLRPGTQYEYQACGNSQPGDAFLCVGGDGRSGSTTTFATPAAPPPPDPVVDAVGDMACAPTDVNFNNGTGNPTAVYPAHNCQQQAVSDLLVNPLPTALLDLGDNQYDNGELSNYESVYNATFGRANSVVYPSLGNAEYANTANATASGFFGYFGSYTGVLNRIAADGGNNTNLNSGGYYSFTLGAWHIVALNSNCSDITGGCGTGSPEEKWLKADLATHPGVCTLAYWHHPRWNSGRLGNDRSGAAFWADLYAAHADIVLGGHANHHYERFLPVQAAPDANGNPIPATNGIRQFIVATGGQSHGQPPATPGDQNASVVTNYTTYGILKLTLHSAGYDWHFIPAAGATFNDSGTAACNSATG